MAKHQSPCQNPQDELSAYLGSCPSTRLISLSLLLYIQESKGSEQMGSMEDALAVSNMVQEAVGQAARSARREETRRAAASVYDGQRPSLQEQPQQLHQLLLEDEPDSGVAKGVVDKAIENVKNQQQREQEQRRQRQQQLQQQHQEEVRFAVMDKESWS